jgi:hypothetical protein
MKLLLCCFALFVGQIQTSQNQDVVRLPPHTLSIPATDGGKMVELLYAEPVLSLPKNPPPVDAAGEPWYIDVKNFGPGDVQLTGNNGFAAHLRPKDVVRIRTVGGTYTAGRP